LNVTTVATRSKKSTLWCVYNSNCSDFRTVFSMRKCEGMKTFTKSIVPCNFCPNPIIRVRFNMPCLSPIIICENKKRVIAVVWSNSLTFKIYVVDIRRASNTELDLGIQSSAGTIWNPNIFVIHNLKFASYGSTRGQH